RSLTTSLVRWLRVGSGRPRPRLSAAGATRATADPPSRDAAAHTKSDGISSCARQPLSVPLVGAMRVGSMIRAGHGWIQRCEHAVRILAIDPHVTIEMR